MRPTPDTIPELVPAPEATPPPAQKSAPAASDLSEAKRRLLAERLKGTATLPIRANRIQPRPAGARTVIGPDQYNIWLDTTLHPDEPTYNEIVTVRYRGEIDAALLEESFNRFLARHEGWRTSYMVDTSDQGHGEVLQVVNPVVRLNPLTLIDLAHLPPAEADAESKRLATEQARRFIDLEIAPLFRATLVRLAPNDCRLHITISHMIFDGYSLRRVFLVELATIYAALESGTEPQLPPVQLHYADFTIWRNRYLDTPAMQAHLDYWRKKLAGELPLLRLPSDRPRPAVITHRGGIERFKISLELTEALRKLGHPYRASFYMTLLASFKALMFRYSGQEDILIGSVADGRRRPELESMMGYMIDVFAVRSQPSAQLKFSEYLVQIRQTLLEALAAAEAPFARVVQALGHKRDLSHGPVFQTIFVLEPPQEPFGKWSVGATEITIGASKYDLYVEADEHADHTGVSIDYSTDLFDAPTIRRMMAHWQTLLQAIVADPETLLGDLPILTVEERTLMLGEWNRTETALPDEPNLQTMHGLVEVQARRTPNAPAVTFDRTTLTYAQLSREADRLAHHLANTGAAPETLTAVFLDRSQYLVAGLLGVLKTGAAYLPLDPGTPAARIALCLEDAAPAVILTQRAQLANLPASTARIVVLEDVLAAPYPAPFSHPPVHPTDLAYVIHTSGSTGRPKGVELNHAGVANLLLSMQREPGFTPADTLVAVTTISFDIAVLELFLPLITGGQVVIASRADALDPQRLATLLRDCKATVLQATPATWSALLGVDWQGQPNLKALCGGEALNRSLADRLLALTPSTPMELWNVYGPTETTIWSTVRRVYPGTGPIPVGRPIANTTAYILDAQQQPVPINVPGELYLGGIGLARGYRNKPTLTAEKFIPNPFSPENRELGADPRLYRTGDYALYRHDGTIEVQGRADNQVKIRGYRIELEDVEVNLTLHPQVAFAAAKAWPDPSGGHRLCAYLVGVAGPPPTASQMRQFLRGRVADYMIPSEIIALDAMPLTSNGKIDRKQLAEPEYTAPTPGASTALTASDLTGEELRIARIWSELLHVDHIASTDNFFDLGGHSLLLLKLVRQLNKEFAAELHTELQIAQLFQAPTVEKLAQVVRAAKRHTQHQQEDHWNSLVPLNPRGTRRPFFLIHSLMLYGRLPAALGDDQPFYALQMLPLGEDPSKNWVEAMLDDHIRQIKKVQPHGPYQLAGWCFAGWLAYEIARRLEAAGDQVSLLALLDSWCPYKVTDDNLAGTAAPERNSLAARLRTLVFKIDFGVRQLLRLRSSERAGHIHRVLRDQWSTFLMIFRRVFKSRLYRLGLRLNLPLPAMLQDSWVVTYEWLRQYRVQPYRGDLALIRPGDIAVPPDSDPNCGWRALTAGEIRSYFVPGDRSTMFLGPNLAVLADLLRTLMS
jgi:amino acid adenylation domain-containing protein